MQMKKLYMIGTIIFLNICTFSYAQEPESLLDKFSVGTELYLHENYMLAGATFEYVFRHWPDDELAAQGCFMAMQSFFNAHEYSKAFDLGTVFINDFPSHPNALNAEYLRARILFLNGQYFEAISAFDSIIKNYPESTLFPSIRFWTAESYYRLGIFGESLPIFNEIIQKWPNSEKASLSAWRLNVMGLEAREAKLLRLIEFEGQQKRSEELEKLEEDVYAEQSALRENRSARYNRQVEDAYARLRKTNLLLDAQKRLIEVLLSRIRDSSEGISQ